LRGVAFAAASLFRTKEGVMGKRRPQRSKRDRDRHRYARKARKHAMMANEARSAAILEEYGPQGTACARKVRYQSWYEAERYAAHYELLRDVRLRSYRCPRCGGWHLTHERGGKG